MSNIVLTELAATPVDLPGAGQRKIYFKTATGHLYMVDTAGTETQLTGGASSTPGYTPFIVGLDVGDAYSTIASALAAASAEFISSGRTQHVHVKPGTYGENLVWPEGVTVSSVSADAMIHPFASLYGAGTPLIAGVHTFAVPTGHLTASIRGINFIRNSATTDLFAMTGTATGSVVVFDGCTFVDGLPCTNPMFDLVGGGSGDMFVLNACHVIANCTPQVMAVDGGGIFAVITGSKWWANAAGSQYGISVDNSGAHGSPARLVMSDSGTVGGGVVLADDTAASLTRTNFDTDGAGVAAVDIAAAAGCDATHCSFRGDSGVGDIDGTGTFTDTGNLFSGSPVQGITYNTGRTGLSSSNARSPTRAVSGAAVHSIKPYEGVVLCDTNVPLGNVDLPDPAQYPGHCITVVDETPNAVVNTITITSVASSIIGQSLIVTNGESITYRSDGAAWRVISIFP